MSTVTASARWSPVDGVAGATILGTTTPGHRQTVRPYWARGIETRRSLYEQNTPTRHERTHTLQTTTTLRPKSQIVVWIQCQLRCGAVSAPRGAASGVN